MDEATHKKNFKPINLRDLFMDKNPRPGKWIPPFAFRSLPRMLSIDFFNDLASIRKLFGIKASLEMFLPPNETYRHRNQHFVLTFGKPIHPETFDKRHTPQEWAQLVRDQVYIIAEDPYREFSYIKN